MTNHFTMLPTSSTTSNGQLLLPAQTVVSPITLPATVGGVVATSDGIEQIGTAVYFMAYDLSAGASYCYIYDIGIVTGIDNPAGRHFPVVCGAGQRRYRVFYRSIGTGNLSSADLQTGAGIPQGHISIGKVGARDDNCRPQK